MAIASFFRSQVAGVFLAALVLTIFEIVFFFWIIGPTTANKVKDGLGYLTSQLSEDSQALQIPTPVIDDIAREEKDLINKYNQSLIGDASWIGGLLIISILVLALFQSPDMLLNKSSAIFSIGSSVLFIAFQVYFFFLVALKYNYPTPPELELASLKGLDKALS